MKHKLLIVVLLDLLLVAFQVNCYIMKSTGEYLWEEYRAIAFIPTIIILIILFVIIAFAKKENKYLKTTLLTLNIIFAIMTLPVLEIIMNPGFTGRTLCSQAAGCKDNEDGKTVTCHLVKEDKTLSKRTFTCDK